MGMVVRTNMAALNANNSLQQASKAQQNGMQKLASGFKINKAADDASGLAISEKMKNQIKALDTAKDNCEDGANMIQTAEGYMSEAHDILNRMTELAEKSANGVLADEDRNSLQKEMDELCGEIDRIATTANFNGRKLLDGSLGGNDSVALVADKENKKITYLSPDKNAFKGATLDTSKMKEGKYKATALSGKDISTQGTAITMTNKETGEVVTTKIALKNGSTVTFEKGDAVSGGTAAMSGNDGTFSLVEVELKDAIGSGGKVTLTYNDGEWYDNATGDKVTDKIKSAKVTIAADAEFSQKEGIGLQIGDSSTKADRLSVSMNSMHTDTLFKGLDGFVNSTSNSDNNDATAAVKIKQSNDSSTYKSAVSIDISQKECASAAADAIRQVSNYVSDERGKLGAQQNRLDHTVNNLSTASENTSAANSRIRDTDMAKEMMAYTSKNVIAQAAQTMLAQANSQPQNVLSLLQG